MYLSTPTPFCPTVVHHSAIASVSSWPRIRCLSVPLPYYCYPRRSRSQQDCSQSSKRRCDRVLAGYVPGRGADGAAHVQAERRGHVHVPARERDPERVRADVVMPVCAGLDACENESASGSCILSFLCTLCAGPGWVAAERRAMEWTA